MHTNLSLSCVPVSVMCLNGVLCSPTYSCDHYPVPMNRVFLELGICIHLPSSNPSPPSLPLTLSPPTSNSPPLLPSPLTHSLLLLFVPVFPDGVLEANSLSSVFGQESRLSWGHVAARRETGCPPSNHQFNEEVSQPVSLNFRIEQPSSLPPFPPV